MAGGKAEPMNNNAGEVGVYFNGDGESDKFLDDFVVDRIRVGRKARIIGTPVENGEQRFDNKVLDPKTVTVTGHINVFEGKKEAENRLRQMYESREYKFYYVVGKGDGSENFFRNLMLQDYDTDEDPEKFELVHVTLVFLEVKVTEQSERKTADEADSPTVNEGDSSPPVAQPKSDNERRLSTIRSLGILE